MLTPEIMERVRRMNEQLGSNNGACFGTMDASRLRQNSPPVRPIRNHDYRLIFLRDGREQELCFYATSLWEAYVTVKAELRIKTRLSPKKFLASGGKKLIFGGKQVFPPR